MRSDSAAYPRADSTSRGANTTGTVGVAKSCQPSCSGSDIRRRRPNGPVARTRCLGRSDSLPVQRSQPSTCCKFDGHLNRDRSRYVRILHNHGASDWQYSNGLYRLDRESPPIETRSRQGPVRTRPQRRPTYCIQLHQFRAVELRNYFASNFDIEDLRGLDLFHSRFAADPRWNPVSPTGDSELANELERLERAHATSMEFMDRALHLLLVARSRRPAASTACVVGST